MPTCSSLQLERVVDVLLQSRAGSDDGAQLIHVQATADGFDLGVKPAPGHPSEHLLGFVAPDEWDALGVAASGWAAPVGGARPSLHPKRTRVHSVVLVARDARVVGKVASADGRVVESMDGPPSAGLLLDCLQRALGLPTPPPESSTAELFALHWLSDIAASGTGRRSVGWAEAAILHPASRLLAAEGEAPDARMLIEWARALARVCDWPEARWRAIEDGWLQPQVDPSLAAWMDDGMFARWVCPEGAVHTAASVAGTALTPSAQREVRRVLRRLSIRVDG